MGCHLWGCTELDTTEATQQQQPSRTKSPIFLSTKYISTPHTFFSENTSYLSIHELCFTSSFCSLVENMSRWHQTSLASVSQEDKSRRTKTCLAINVPIFYLT